MSNNDSSGVVYLREFPDVSSSVTYIDPLAPPAAKFLRVRGLLESSWCLIFSFMLVPFTYALNEVLAAAGLPHLWSAVAIFLGVAITYLVFLPMSLGSAKRIKKEFIELGGDATGISLFMFMGMMPMDKGKWQAYKFLKDSSVKKHCIVKPVTGPFF